MNSLAGMSPRELELLERFIAKANPPPILHRYRRASKWTIKELTVPEVHITGIEDMNDPFEYRAPLSIDLEKMRESFYTFCREKRGMDHEQAKQEAASVDSKSAALLQNGIEALRADSGLICCSSNPRSNRMWSYYGDGHKGISIGYNTAFPPFFLAHQVAYADPTGSIDLLDTLTQDPCQLADHLSCRKGSEWAFEQEFRIPVGPFPKKHTRLLPIDPAAVAEIRLGAKICPEFKEQIVSLVSGLPHKPRLIQMKCDHKTFRLTDSTL